MMEQLETIEALKRTSKGCGLFRKPDSNNNNANTVQFKKDDSDTMQTNDKIRSHSKSPEVIWKTNAELSTGDEKENRQNTLMQESSSDNKPKYNNNDDINDDSQNFLSTPLNKISLSESIISYCDEEIDLKVKNFMLAKQSDLERKETKQRENVLVEKNVLQEKVQKKILKIQDEDNDFERAYNEELMATQNQLKEVHNRHAQLLNKRDSDAQKDALRKEQEKLEQKVVKGRKEVHKCIEEMNNLLKVHNFTDNLPPPVGSCVDVLKQISDKIADISSPATLTDLDARSVAFLSAEAKKIIAIAETLIVEASRKRLEEKIKESEKAVHIRSSTAAEVATTFTKTTSAKTASSAAPQVSSRLSPQPANQCRAIYMEFLKLLNSVEMDCKEFEEDTVLKKYRFSLMKAVSENVNTINNNEPGHLHDKVEKFIRLLEGGTIGVSGDQNVSTRDHPVASLYCLNRLAKKLVNQGGELVSSRPEAAFIYSPVVVGLWCKYPIFGKLFLVHLALKCPFLVPYIIEREGKSDLEYFQMLGYDISDNGELEKESLFLKRFSGYVTFYAAVTVSQPPSNHLLGRKIKLQSPHGLQNAWTWLARVLGQPPIQGITPTALHSFLEVVGFEMGRCYGKQFFKMLQFLKFIYLPEIKKVTTDSDKIAPLERLRLFVDGAFSKGKIVRHPGLKKMIK
ncbi:hypothetical protein HELRODRAFT_190497 [Helobdella robusta]|uniref:mRNA export factor GLE1 n=1 Tax=Helobdella robusta TaxID=6412 RepID=T1FS16_HELRO|nr:hypothetical protein HELRODRAFT_190497 [Helobdella robusta]ESO09442.1 hypothetical protein HELRODRAFT_190497 [Helobdella robusta]